MKAFNWVMFWVAISFGATFLVSGCNRTDPNAEFQPRPEDIPKIPISNSRNTGDDSFLPTAEK